MSQRVPPPVPVEYPSSDGRPMAENDAQRAAIMYAIGALGVWYAESVRTCTCPGSRSSATRKATSIR